MTAYYNEHDPKAAAWIRELIRRGLVAPGDVDERSIEDVRPADLAGYRQCHFFAGVAGWSLALRFAGIPDDYPVWTGSCPCQPFSTAGKRAGFADERHLWPAFFHLIGVCGIERAIGEQVAGRDGLAWLDLVAADLEGMGYACGAVVAPAAGFGAPHIRERLHWMADANHARPQGRGQPGRERAAERLAGADGVAGGVALTYDTERRADAAGWHDSLGPDTGRAQGAGDIEGRGPDGRPGPVNGFWRDADWLGCRDGKWRPVEPGLEPLADGIPARMVRLRGYGNAVVVQQAAAFARAALQ